MKKMSSKLIVLILICSLVVGTASAVTQDPWGPQFYTPYTGKMGAYDWGVSANSLRWSSEQITALQSAQNTSLLSLSIELEFRPGVPPITLWYKPSDADFIFNFPSAYYEFEDGLTEDDNDVAVCSAYPAAFTTTGSYYGTIWLTPKADATFTGRRVVLESEYGTFIYGESVPMNYEVYPGETYFGQYYTW